MNHNGKGNDPLLSVSEFADLVGASRSRLLFYDKEGYFPPAARMDAGRQASNRRYHLDQVFQYRMLDYLQQMGCSLEEAGRYINTDDEQNDTFLQAREEDIRQKMRRLRAMEGSIQSVLKLRQLSQGSKPDAPVFFSLDEPFPMLYHAFDTPCLRGTRCFARAYAGGFERLSVHQDIMPAPLGLRYSVEAGEDGRFPAIGMLMLFSPGADAAQANCTLPAGSWLAFELSGHVGTAGRPMLTNRQYLRDHGLKRRGPVTGWHMSVTYGDAGARFDECIAFPIIEGITPPGEKPTTEGVE